MRRRNVKQIEAENDKKQREELFKKTHVLSSKASLKNQQRYDRQVNVMKDRAEKTTEMLNSLVLRMSEQVKQSEETTATLIHSSAVLKETHSHFVSVAATVRSGGKLLSKYAREKQQTKY
uniref:Sec20 C-terminal domain-containing protein n=1 Tax=Ditylenchus dipsaci TaxID=166011 RepID=A0A915EVS9_9BILA